MRLIIDRQESYSRGELLLRTFFGYLYIGIPFVFVMLFVGLWASLLGFVAWWVILFTGSYPQNWFNYQVKVMRLQLRVTSRLSHLRDGYPSLSLSADDPECTLEVEYPESLDRLDLLLKSFFGFFYVLLPHSLILLFRGIWASILNLIGWFSVLFTGNYPESAFNFQVENIRWSLRVNIYMANMTDNYPPFNGKE